MTPDNLAAIYGLVCLGGFLLFVVALLFDRRKPHPDDLAQPHGDVPHVPTLPAEWPGKRRR